MSYFQLHTDTNLNYQMNRALIGGRLEDVRSVSEKIHNFSDWKREMLAIALIAEKENRIINAFSYYRAAEFFMTADDPDRKPTVKKFMTLFYETHKADEIELNSISFEGSFLHAMVLRCKNPKGSILFHGGFDSYIEEFYNFGSYFRTAGYDVFMFDGPGQGTTLIENKVPMTYQWEKPVACVLNYYALNDVTLIGLSLGGFLALRAAAFEPRIKRVVAFDVLTDFFDVLASKRGPILGKLLKIGVSSKIASLVNFTAKVAMKSSLIATWGIEQGMHNTASKTPYEFFKKAKLYETKTISSLIKQDVLLMAGSEDHFVPPHQFYDQIKTIKNSRSLTARLFTRAEEAENHCQFGNIDLALKCISNWIAERSAILERKP